VRSRLLFSSVEESGRKPPSPDRAFSEILIQYSRVWAEGNADTAVVGAERVAWAPKMIIRRHENGTERKLDGDVGS